MKFLMIDDLMVEGETYTDVVAAMARSKMRRPRSLEQYRQSTADRILEVYQLKIDPSTDETFVKSMIVAGLMRKTRAKSR